MKKAVSSVCHQGFYYMPLSLDKNAIVSWTGEATERRYSHNWVKNKNLGVGVPRNVCESGGLHVGGGVHMEMEAARDEHRLRRTECRVLVTGPNTADVPLELWKTASGITGTEEAAQWTEDDSSRALQCVSPESGIDCEGEASSASEIREHSDDDDYEGTGFGQPRSLEDRQNNTAPVVANKSRFLALLGLKELRKPSSSLFQRENVPSDISSSKHSVHERVRRLQLRNALQYLERVIGKEDDPKLSKIALLSKAKRTCVLLREQSKRLREEKRELLAINKLLKSDVEKCMGSVLEEHSYSLSHTHNEQTREKHKSAQSLSMDRIKCTRPVRGHSEEVNQRDFLLWPMSIEEGCADVTVCGESRISDRLQNQANNTCVADSDCDELLITNVRSLAPSGEKGAAGIQWGSYMKAGDSFDERNLPNATRLQLRRNFDGHLKPILYLNADYRLAKPIPVRPQEIVKSTGMWELGTSAKRIAEKYGTYDNCNGKTGHSAAKFSFSPPPYKRFKHKMSNKLAVATHSGKHVKDGISGVTTSSKKYVGNALCRKPANRCAKASVHELSSPRFRKNPSDVTDSILAEYSATDKSLDQTAARWRGMPVLRSSSRLEKRIPERQSAAQREKSALHAQLSRSGICLSATPQGEKHNLQGTSKRAPECTPHEELHAVSNLSDGVGSKRAVVGGCSTSSTRGSGASSSRISQLRAMLRQQEADLEKLRKDMIEFDDESLG